MKYPSKKNVERIKKKLADVEGTLMVGPSASPAEHFRWELCQNLVKFMAKEQMSQVEFAKHLEIDQARVSEIVNHRIDRVSTDKLLELNSKIDPRVRFKIAR
jgi:predicted XRE-type DNA-binding protein